MPNRLSTETSPYLLQHAHNPVDWYPWGSEALDKARAENKLILVSIGYSACHWCHVMEHECFEDQAVAEIMNKHFICIKVDREERPDVDQVYMLALQLMTGQGGWPLNCICLPDQRPIYGGTYFQKHSWISLLQQLADFWAQSPPEAEAYATRLTQGIQETEKLDLSGQPAEYTQKDLDEILSPWRRLFDRQEGGYNRAPKFPLPNNWQFLLRYASLSRDEEVHEAVRLTLRKMAFGGIYDQLGGGFARYSVDGYWHVPHFEKMLYDNAQLVSLYAEAWQCYADPLYKDIVYETIQWLRREMRAEAGGYFSALDADSEGVEGKFYTFSYQELQSLLSEDELRVFAAYYNLRPEGNWPEEQTNVLIRKEPPEDMARSLGMEPGHLAELLGTARSKAFGYREQRVRPGLDNKILAGWNGMMLKAYADAYRAFGDPDFLQEANALAQFIAGQLIQPSGSLRRLYKAETSPGEAPGLAFLDDYALVIEGFISLYEAGFDEHWLQLALHLTEYVTAYFYDAGTGMFYYTAQTDKELIARKHEITDNVIPASNSVMAHNLLRLGHLFYNESYLEQADTMLANVFAQLRTYGSGYSNWCTLLLYKVFGLYEIAITGPQAADKAKELGKSFIPNKILLGGSSGSLPLLQDKWMGNTMIFVCKNRTCRLPVTEVAEALKQLVN